MRRQALGAIMSHETIPSSVEPQSKAIGHAGHRRRLHGPMCPSARTLSATRISPAIFQASHFSKLGKAFPIATATSSGATQFPRLASWSHRLHARTRRMNPARSPGIPDAQ